MKNLDRMPITEKPIFAWALYQDGTINDEALIPYHILGSFLVGGATATLSFMFLPWYIATLVLVATLVFWNGSPYVGKLSPFYKIPDEQLYSDGTVKQTYDHRHRDVAAPGSRTLMYKIMDLPREDRKLFPHDLMDILSRDLLPTARYELNASLAGTLQDIAARDEQRREMARKGIAHEGVLAAIESTRENIQIETKTLKEFS